MEEKTQATCSCGCSYEHHDEHHHEHVHAHGSCCHGEHVSEEKNANHRCSCHHGHEEQERHDDCACGHGHHHHEHSCTCGDVHHEHSCDCGHEHHHHEDGCACGCGHDHNHEQDPAEVKKELTMLVTGAAALVLGILLPGIVGKLVLLVAFAVVAWDIVLGAVKNIRRGDVFGENFLMTIAGVGAVCIGEIPEGVMVFLLYRLGEYLQTKAVSSSRKSISALLDVRPDRANLLVDGVVSEVEAADVVVGQTILVRPGEKIPLDGTVLSGCSQLDTAALTGESMPRDVEPGQTVMAGCINLSGALELRVDKSFGESTASKILEMVEHASEKKAASEKFITRFARVYTPVVVVAAAVVAVLPPVLGLLVWKESLYSALCFLAISCPCALVISVPLSFFAGIGRASREGVLVKGGNHLEVLAAAEIVAFDKTGTLTQGCFSIAEIVPVEGITKEDLLEKAALAESRSTHPIAQSIVSEWEQNGKISEVSEYHEVSGHGVTASVGGCLILAGKADYLVENGIRIPSDTGTTGTAVHVSVDGVYQGVILLRDQPKADAKTAIASLKELGIRHTAMLSGDSEAVAEAIGCELGLDSAVGELLPGEKLEQLDLLRNRLSRKGKLLYAGDGINDTPVLAAADIGIAMGGLGADAAIETADVIIMGDEPGKIAAGVKIARYTVNIATQNIIFSIAIKVLVMLLSILGHVDLWAAVLADVGVCMLCILNTLRINRCRI